MKVIEVQYNEFSNWEQPIKVNFPECEHPDKYISIETVGRGELTEEVVFCNVCGKIKLADTEAKEYYWEAV